MDENKIAEIKDGDSTRAILLLEAPSMLEVSKQKLEVSVKKKRRRGKSKRKIMKPFSKIPWQERRRNENTKRKNRFRKIVLAKTQAPFNNNQFLMEIHKPEPENNYHILKTPTARTRDSSFSVDSEDNYFYSLPEDEEEYLTKEFSSVYEDAQCERLSNMSKNELIQEYLLLEAKYDNLLKRTDRYKLREADECSAIEQDASMIDRDSMLTDRDTSATSTVSGSVEESAMSDLMQRMRGQDEQICELQLANEKLKLENEHLRQKAQATTEDSESDSSSSTDSGSSSSRAPSPVADGVPQDDVTPEQNNVEMNGDHVTDSTPDTYPLVNGFHDSSD